jgi:membrane-bound serine protease (ClpP class)
VGGIVSLVLGSLMLFKSPDPAIRVSLEVVAAMAVFAALVVGFLVSVVLKAHRRQVQTGLEGLIHERGVARSSLAPRGKVFVHGEIWEAASRQAVAAGEPVEVVGVDGRMLVVEPRRESTVVASVPVPGDWQKEA